MFLNGPPQQKVTAKVDLVKYAGKKKPITPGVRHAIQAHHPHLHSGSPLRDLTIPLRRKGGRSTTTGQVVNRFVGGGHKRRLRIVDFRREEPGECEVVRVEYDPGRSAHIALIRNKQIAAAENKASRDAVKALIPSGGEVEFGEYLKLQQALSASRSCGRDNDPHELPKVQGGYSYILAPEGLRAGDVVRSYRAGIPAGIVEGYGGSSPSSSSDPSTPQTVLPPSADVAGSTTSSSRALGMLRTLTLKPGNVLPLHLCPPGTIIHNISLSPSGKMQLCRSAGSFGQVVAHHIGLGKRDDPHVTSGRTAESSNLAVESVVERGASEGALLEELEAEAEAKDSSTHGRGWALVKLQSGEVRRLHPDCVATVGSVSNKEHQQEQIGKAGRARWLGIKPRVRGVAMNTCDHPHGGGRGKSKGNKDPRSVWGWLTKKRTRRPKDRDGNKMVVTERPRGKARRS